MLRAAIHAIIADAGAEHAPAATPKERASLAHHLEVPPPPVQRKRDYGSKNYQERQWKREKHGSYKCNAKVNPDPEQLAGQKTFGVIVQCPRRQKRAATIYNIVDYGMRFHSIFKSNSVAR